MSSEGRYLGCSCCDSGAIFGCSKNEPFVKRGVVKTAEQAGFNVFAELFRRVGERLCVAEVVF